MRRVPNPPSKWLGETMIRLGYIALCIAIIILLGYGVLATDSTNPGAGPCSTCQEACPR